MRHTHTRIHSLCIYIANDMTPHALRVRPCDSILHFKYHLYGFLRMWLPIHIVYNIHMYSHLSTSFTALVVLFHLLARARTPPIYTWRFFSLSLSFDSPMYEPYEFSSSCTSYFFFRFSSHPLAHTLFSIFYLILLSIQHESFLSLRSLYTLTDVCSCVFFSASLFGLGVFFAHFLWLPTIKRGIIFAISNVPACVGKSQRQNEREWALLVYIWGMWILCIVDLATVHGISSN